MKTLTTFVFMYLLIFGYVDHDNPYGHVIRLLELFIIPIVSWYALYFIKEKINPTSEQEARFSSSLWGVIAGVFFMAAFNSYNARTHIDGTIMSVIAGCICFSLSFLLKAENEDT